MTMKSLLLGAAASLAALATAQAADLPMTKGEAVEYVKVCSAFGPGFFYIPGSDTCLKIAGEIRADYRGYNQSGDGLSGNNNYRVDGYKQNRNIHSSAFNTEARISFDARTQTEFGLLRSFFQIRGNSHPINWDSSKDTSGNTFSIKYAYIQFGGLTAGYAHSFFGFYDLDFGNTVWGPYYAQSNVVNLLAYTADFGGGFTATLSIEDGRDHRQNAFRSTQQGGQQIPDVVGQIRLKQDWGSVSVQAAAHQYRTAEPAVDANGVLIPAGTAGYYPRENKWGYAVGGTLLVNIPVIDKGHFVIEGQYADGALDYLGIGSSKLKGQDFFVTSNNRTIDGGKGWSVTAELGGNFTPQWGANLVGAYIDTTYDKFSNLGDRKVQEYSLTGNLTYTIVKGLTVTGEVTYTHQQIDNLSYVPAAGVAAISRDAKSDFWTGGVRIKRTF